MRRLDGKVAVITGAAALAARRQALGPAQRRREEGRRAADGELCGRDGAFRMPAENDLI
jgi:hypothetical protein